jgi:bifunctional DNA-binding transcriptional regulator/antitoxin component of YhaV-PrlF toxin-antitoxin module
MTTTVNVRAQRQLFLPEEFCRRKKIKPGTAVRVTEVGDGLYVTPVPEPTEAELKQVMAAAGSLLQPQDAAGERLVAATIKRYRAEQRGRRR